MTPEKPGISGRIEATPAGGGTPSRGLTLTNRLDRLEGSVEPILSQATPAIAPELAAEFRGLFFGEGHLDLVRNSSLITLYPRARIAVRDDDIAVVEWCVELFGGNLSRRAQTRSVCWQATGHVRIGHILDALEGGSLPSKKRAEVALMREAWNLAVPRGAHMPPENRARLFVLRDELKALRGYVEVAS